MKTAKGLIAEGYRLHWVTVEKRIPVLCMPEDADAIGGHTAEDWACDDVSDWLVMAQPMERADAEVRECLPFCDCDDIDGDPPTIGELLDAQAEVAE
jgi:hypothetical protein